jgi:hypothetical protein
MKRFFVLFDIKQIFWTLWIIFGCGMGVVVPLLGVTNRFPSNVINISISVVFLISFLLLLLSRIKKGYLFTDTWFWENGIRTEAVFEKVNKKDVPVGDTGTTYREYILEAKGINPVTNEEQIYKQRCREKDIPSLKEGETKITVYLHPKRPKTAYRLFIQN